MRPDQDLNSNSGKPINIVITGANSYIGIAVQSRLEEFPMDYRVDTLDTIGDAWMDAEFQGVDVLFHVAGIVHQKERADMEDLYFRVNCELTERIALKAKQSGVRQFIFLSSMSVYGMESGIIGPDTPAEPTSCYGKSKLEAEARLTAMADEPFRVASLRPPMVYGKGCKGNYPRLAKIARKSPFFPSFPNERSMIHVEHLSEFIRLLIDDGAQGLFFPQNTEYVCTSEMVGHIAEAHGRKIRSIAICNPLIRHLHWPMVKKVFGSLVYAKELSVYSRNYNLYDFPTTIRLTEL